MAEGVVDRRTSDGYRGFLVSRKVSHWGLVQSGACVDVDCVDDILSRLRRLYERLVKLLVLPSGCQEQTSIWRKRESPEK